MKFKFKKRHNFVKMHVRVIQLATWYLLLMHNKCMKFYCCAINTNFIKLLNQGANANTDADNKVIGSTYSFDS